VKRLLVALFVLLLARPVSAGQVVIWHAYREAEERALDKLLEQFRRENPGDVVESLAVPYGAYASKLEAAIPHGHGPDVFIDAHERLADFRDRGLVAPLPLEVIDRAAFNGAHLSPLELEGRLYALPIALKCLALYLRGDATPTALDQIPNLAYEAESAYAHAPILHAFGGKMIDGDRYAFADGPAEQSLQWVASRVARGAIPQEASEALIRELFSSGSYSAAISGPWFAADLPKDLTYRVVPIPPVTAGAPRPRPFLTIEGAMLAPKPRDPALASKLLRFLVAPSSAVVRAREGRQVVATRAAWEDPSLANDPFLRGFEAAAIDAIPMPTSVAMRAAWEPTTRAIQKVLRGDVSARAAMDEAARRYADVTRPLPPRADPRFALVLVGLIGLFGAFAAVRAVRDPVFRREVRGSVPAYAYVTHAVIVVALLVGVPLIIGAATSFFAGRSGDLHYVGLANYIDILRARGGPLLASGSFYAVLAVTILWTLCNVVLHLVIGVALALLLARPALRLRGIYRVLLIVPWAVPSYVSALAWKGMFHKQLGAVNAVLRLIGVEPVAWFSKFATAFTANVATNVWLGFPFMMVVTLGALASVPREVLEAAEVDGATKWQRFWLVTFPLLRPTLAPAIVLGAVWTFNMFNVVFLVSGGEPDGRTEILVSEAYRWAFNRQAQYGYASAYAVLIFLLLVFATRLLRAQREAA
jgi:arabinogalactan oligomer / maltooligosaccharide transport system permease protein